LVLLHRRWAGVAAQQIQITYDFASVYGKTATLEFIGQKGSRCP
jgi:hypothetical protein